jgi:hypothetical protein
MKNKNAVSQVSKFSHHKWVPHIVLHPTQKELPLRWAYLVMEVHCFLPYGSTGFLGFIDLQFQDKEWTHLLSSNKHDPLTWKPQLELLENLANFFQILQTTYCSSVKKGAYHCRALQDRERALH